MDTADGMKAWNSAVDSGRPLVIAVGFLCTDYCVFNRNVHYRNRREEQQSRRSGNRPMLKNIIDSLHRQADAGRVFLFENPPPPPVRSGRSPRSPDCSSATT